MSKMLPDNVLQLIQGLALPHWLPPSFVMAHVQIESDFDPNAIGSDGSGSLGLMQVLPATAVDMGGGNQTDPLVSLRTGVRYIIWLHGYLTGHGINCVDYAGSIAEAYNEGPGNRVHGHRDPVYHSRWVTAQAQWRHVDTPTVLENVIGL